MSFIEIADDIRYETTVIGLMLVFMPLAVLTLNLENLIQNGLSNLQLIVTTLYGALVLTGAVLRRDSEFHGYLTSFASVNGLILFMTGFFEVVVNDTYWYSLTLSSLVTLAGPSFVSAVYLKLESKTSSKKDSELEVEWK